MKFPPEYILTPPEMLAARAERAAALVEELGLDGLLLTHVTDVFYLSGTAQQGLVRVDPNQAPTLYIRQSVERAAAESPLPVHKIAGLGQVGRDLLQDLPQNSRLGLTLDVMPAAQFLGWQKRLPGVELVDVSRPWLETREIKDDFELQMMSRAGRLAAELYAQVPSHARPGLSEAQVVGEFLRQGLARGMIDLIRDRGNYLSNFTWHLASGPQGALPSGLDAPFAGLGPAPAFPHGASLKPLVPGEPFILDVGVCLHGYLTDQTRTFCLGPAPEEVRRAHACLQAVQAALVQGLEPGAKSGELFARARQVADQHGMGEFFLGRPQHRIRFVGHGLGLELGTPPYLLENSPARVRARETYALELKIVLPQGPVGLENTFAVNQQGPPTLLSPIPDDLVEIPI